MDGSLQDNTVGYRLGGDFQPGGLLVESLQVIIFALAICIVVYLFFAVPNQVEGSSMDPTLKNGDILLTNKFIQLVGGEEGVLKDYDYERGDIIVFQQPGKPDLVKRIIGMPGDRIKIRDGRVVVNGEVYVENYLPNGMRTQSGAFLPENQEKRVPDGSYFVMGDNRSKSKDSRTTDVGFVSREDMKGSPFLRITPLDQFGLLESGTVTKLPEEEVFE